MGIHIEPGSLVTLQNQIRNELLREIREGNFQPGQKIYTEQQIRDMTGISLVTIKAALASLVKDGVLIRKQGKGTYVREKKINIVQPLNQFYSFIKDYSRLGYKASIKVFDKSVGKVEDEEIINALNLKKGDLIFKLFRIMLLDNEPIDLDYTYLPYNIFKGIENFDFEKIPLYDIIQNDYGLEICKARETIEPIALNKAQAENLKSHKGKPALLVKRTSFDCNNNIIEFTHTIVHGEKYKYSFELVKKNEQ